jgi:Tol biopolymer transport system component
MIRAMYWRGCVAIVVGVGCGSVKATPDGSVSSDSSMQTGDAPPAPACDLGKPFGAATQVPVLHDSAGNDTHATLTADELTIYFASDRMGNNIWHLYTSTRTSTNAAFATPTLLSSTYTQQGESHPSISPDGNTIYFDSFRVQAGTVHIFTATRSSAAVNFPTATMITGDFLIDPAITTDGSVLYAANLSSGGLVRMDRNGSGFGTPQSVALPTSSSTVSPVTNDDLTMFMSFGDSVGATIAVTQRASKTTAFPAPAAVSELQIGATVAEPSWLSADGCRLYLTYGMASGKTSIYVATRPN